MDIRTSTHADNQRLVIALTGDPQFLVDIRYEPEKHSLRVIQGGSRRLFFYEADTFFPSRGILLNEYGLVVGKLQMRSSEKGLIQLDDTRVSVLDEPGKGWVELQVQGLSEPVFWHYDSAHTQVAVHSDPILFRSVLLVLAWSVGVAVLQQQA
ncbi:hypothetical protein SAMN05444008_108128 [Cnuella takakiae]|uniref:Uncharacterized protein n=1 Tax=Cnuella takakiae TaxID=1302690 RepID=A0A1M5BWW0_9BACT|nr:hypothetical protein [Cnuella takakiae]OLY93540.1 hypothetical protein BUE76_17905 [Cnuella takakiae]SHF46905.1 hypothetical protein SAMN05444008_108128 [Cnuella takakiae]